MTQKASTPPVTSQPHIEVTHQVPRVEVRIFVNLDVDDLVSEYDEVSDALEAVDDACLELSATLESLVSVWRAMKVRLVPPSEPTPVAAPEPLSALQLGADSIARHKDQLKLDTAKSLHPSAPEGPREPPRRRLTPVPPPARPPVQPTAKSTAPAMPVVSRFDGTPVNHDRLRAAAAASAVH